MNVTLHIEVKERDVARVREAAMRFVTAVANIPFDVEVGGLLWDLMKGCGLSAEEIRMSALEGKK